MLQDKRQNKHTHRERGIGVFFTAGVRWDDDDSVDTQFKQEATAAADGDVSNYNVTCNVYRDRLFLYLNCP